MDKEKFISKLNIRDYNNELEKILIKKTFSEDTKNLLLSMLYKIESAYKDYHMVNTDTLSKKELLEELLQIIEKDCDTIEIIKDRKSECLRKENKIITYLNTKTILYELYQLETNKFKVIDKYEIIKSAIEYTMNQAYSIASSEIIRDFDGWSWNIIVDEIENIIANFEYQCLKILVGNEFLIQWRKANKEKDYILKLLNRIDETYKNGLGKEILKVICQISIINFINNNEEERKKFLSIQNHLKKHLEKMDNKEKYLDELARKKKKILSDIKKIDKMMNDDKMLKREFIARNENLDMDHRIFSLSDFEDAIQIERDNLMEELNECSKKMEPLNYIESKTEIDKKYNLLKELNLEEKNNDIYIEKAEELLKLTNKAIEIKISKTEEKENIIKLIYQLRYYSSIYVKTNKQVKQIVNLDKIKTAIITKACKEKCITIFSANIKENYKIVKNIFDVDIIELEKLYFKFTKSQEKLVLEIYDEENISKTVELKQVQELNVKLNKKIKVFIS